MKELLNKIKPITDKITAFYKRISDIATPTAVLTIICIVITLALSSANLLTEDTIDKLAKENQEKAMKELMPGEYENVEATFDDKEVTYTVVTKDDKTIGYIFTTTAKGYGGDIKVMTAVDTKCAIASVKILDASGETPGLGQNVTNKDFYGQFKGSGNKVEAVTGATISSTAVTNAVNEALGYAKQITANSEEAEIEFVESLPKGDES